MTQSPQPTVTLNDGQPMPQFGLGVYQTPPDVTEAVVRKAVEIGYRHVDTAALYRNEDGVGAALADNPAVFVTTKLGNPDHGYDETMRAFETSAKNLRRTPVNLYLIHWPRPKADRYLDSWKAFIQLQKEGRITSIGVSNFNQDHLERIIGETGVTPAVNQIELHPKFQQKALRAFNQGHGIHTESWSPLGQGNQLGEPVIIRIAERLGKTPAQVIIRWHLDSGLVVIPKSVNAERLAENIGALDFKLDPRDVAAIDGMDSAGGRRGPDPAAATF